jgi:hypothetical protein
MRRVLAFAPVINPQPWGTGWNSSLLFHHWSAWEPSLLTRPGRRKHDRKPSGSDFTLELDYLRLEITKFLSLKASLQHDPYTKVKGARSNYDGFGRDASNNNTLYFLLSFMF